MKRPINENDLVKMAEAGAVIGFMMGLVLGFLMGVML